jgi:hypothetical protein
VSYSTLERRQRELVAALVAGAPAPDGFDAGRLAAARRALLNKRAGEAARVWPLLASSLGDQWLDRFHWWAADRAPGGALRDGWGLARELAAHGLLPAPAARELAAREVLAHYRDDGPPRTRRLPALRRPPGWVVLGWLGRVHLLRR